MASPHPLLLEILNTVCAAVNGHELGVVLDRSCSLVVLTQFVRFQLSRTRYVEVSLENDELLVGTNEPGYEGEFLLRTSLVEPDSIPDVMACTLLAISRFYAERAESYRKRYEYYRDVAQAVDRSIRELRIEK